MLNFLFSEISWCHTFSICKQARSSRGINSRGNTKSKEKISILNNSWLSQAVLDMSILKTLAEENKGQKERLLL